MRVDWYCKRASHDDAVFSDCNQGIPRRQPHCRSDLATLSSVGAIP